MSQSGVLSHYTVEGSASAEYMCNFAEVVLVRSLRRLSQHPECWQKTSGWLQAQISLRMQVPFLQPFPAPHSVAVMDGAAVHKAPEFRQIIEAHGAKLQILPPYSPDVRSTTIR